MLVLHKNSFSTEKENEKENINPAATNRNARALSKYTIWTASEETPSLI
jgi:hypothetical protein